MIYFLSGCFITAIIMISTPIFAETASKIEVIFGRVKLMVNGIPLEKETLLYEGTTYVPLRAAAEALDKEVVWDGTTNTAYIDEKGTDRQIEAPKILNDTIPEIPRTRNISAIDHVKLYNIDTISAVNPSGSMQNTIMPGDTVFIDKAAYTSEKPNRFDVIMFQHPDYEDIYYAKRVIGLPGETLEIKEGVIYINGSAEPLNEPYLKDGSDKSEFGPFEVPENHYFLLGDNRSNSFDSRSWVNKCVDEKKIIGEIIFILPPQ